MPDAGDNLVSVADELALYQESQLEGLLHGTNDEYYKPDPILLPDAVSDLLGVVSDTMNEAIQGSGGIPGKETAYEKGNLLMGMARDDQMICRSRLVRMADMATALQRSLRADTGTIDTHIKNVGRMP